MRARILTAFVAAFAFGAGASAATPEDVAAAPDQWRAVNADDMVVFETTKGRVVIELNREMAPGHADRITTLVRDGFYNGTPFHRVLDGFMAQGGDPTGTGTGGSELPNLEAEFTSKLAFGPETVEVGAFRGGRDGTGAAFRASFRNGFPIGHSEAAAAAMLKADPRIRSWMLHCPGVTSMARSTPRNSANSQFFLMRDTARWLDKQYTGWGRILDGQDTVMAIRLTEPPEEGAADFQTPTPDDLDKITRAYVVGDRPAGARLEAWVMRTDTEAFKAVVAQTKAARGNDFDVCDVSVPTVVAG